MTTVTNIEKGYGRALPNKAKRVLAWTGSCLATAIDFGLGSKCKGTAQWYVIAIGVGWGLMVASAVRGRIIAIKHDQSGAFGAGCGIFELQGLAAHSTAGGSCAWVVAWVTSSPAAGGQL
jgi:hypothetical protein